MIDDKIKELIQSEIIKGIEQFKMDTQFEKNKLYAYLGDDLVRNLKKYNAFVAGGTITSIFSNKEINDIDIYFRNENDVIGFLKEIWENGQYVVSNTKKATQLIYNDINVQLIHFNYFHSSKEIFDTFDFTVCMGSFDFSTEQFYFHPDFIKHNSQRILKFNSKTAFPIVSLLRVQKYEKKGFTISKPEFIRIILTCMNLDINTYEDLKEHLGGMYGVNYDKMFEDVDEEEFNLETAIDKIANIVMSEDYFKKPVSIEFNGIDEILDTISKQPRKVLEVNSKLFKINYDGLLESINNLPEYHEKLDTDKYFEETKFYKFVRKTESRYFSYYDGDFEYKIGEEVVANSNKMYSYGRKETPVLYFNEKHDLDSSTYKHKNDSALIEVSIKPEDFDNVKSHITAKKCTVIREVPKEEYKQWKQMDSFEDDEDWGL